MALFRTRGDTKDSEDSTAESQAASDGFFARLRRGLGKTRQGFGAGLGDLLLGKKSIDDDLLEELETRMLLADVGVNTTQRVIEGLLARVRRRDLQDANALFDALQSELLSLLAPSGEPFDPLCDGGPFVILMVGVNGAGKTTTIGKLTRQYLSQGRTVMLAAGDTFRAAAVEQLQSWGERNAVPVIAQHAGADSASVIFDAMEAARARGIDVLIADTAGRLHTKANLMEELKKVVRVVKRLDPDAPHEVMLVMDAGTGQNGLAQARHFVDAVDLTGITLTKLDGTAKGGIVFSISAELGLPIRYIGIGEGVDDLRPFDAAEFVRALCQE